MTHLDLADVADLVRGISPPPAREAMERHLATGCERCRRAVALFREVAHAGREDGQWEPPTAVVRLATAILPRPVAFRHRLLGRLIFDSLCQPLPAGVRSLHRRSRQVMYRAGGYFVDLRVDHEQGPRRVSLVGQVASRDAADPRPAEAFLVQGNRAVRSAPINEFGEFAMEYAPGPRLRLRIPLDRGELGLDVPLARLADGSPRLRRPKRP
jgi:anti-sigma factor RsiW